MESFESFEKTNTGGTFELMMKQLELGQKQMEQREALKQAYEKDKENFYDRMQEMTGLSKDFMKFVDSPEGMKAATERYNNKTQMERESLEKLFRVPGFESAPNAEWLPSMNEYLDQQRIVVIENLTININVNDISTIKPYIDQEIIVRGIDDIFRGTFGISPEERTIFDPIVREPAGIGDIYRPEIIPTPEGTTEFREYDDYSERAGEVIKDIFTPEVIENWKYLSLDQRMQLFDMLGKDIGLATGVNITEVYPSDLGNSHGVNCGDGRLGLNIRFVDDPGELTRLIDTVVHEGRHQLQFDAIKNPQDFPWISPELISRWKENFTPGVYIDPMDDFQGYYEQLVEVDARMAAGQATNIWYAGLDNRSKGVLA